MVLARHPDGHAHKYELERVAATLATTGLYGNPYAIPTGPTAHVAPGYTLILAGLFRVFGTGVGGVIAQMVLASVITALIGALLPSLAGVLRLPLLAGVIAGLIFALSPVQIDGAWESPYVLLALMLIAGLTVHLWREQNTAFGSAALYGVCWGIALLFAPAMLTTFVVLAIAGIYFFRQAHLRSYLAFVVVETLVVGLCLAPWAIRNERAFGSPVFTRSNFGLELRVSNNDQAGADQMAAITNGAFRKFHPFMSIAEAMRVRDMGEVAYNKEELRLAREWIFAHPRKFVELSLTRARYVWFGHYPAVSSGSLSTRATVTAQRTLHYLTALFALLGLIYVVRNQFATGTVLLILLLTYTAPYYFVHFTHRYVYPVEWILMLLSAVVLVEIWQRWYRAIRVNQHVSAARPVPISA